MWPLLISISGLKFGSIDLINLFFARKTLVYKLNHIEKLFSILCHLSCKKSGI